MQYIRVHIPTADSALKEILIAILEDSGFEGFEETDESLIAFIDEQAFDESVLKEILEPHALSYAKDVIPKQNWNALWESNFEPVIVEGFCTVRADFHDIVVTTPYEIIITPKMSFGTGHHATTQLVMMQMQQMDIQGKTVFDFGTGTGILAILAEMLGAKSVSAIDNDEWSFENTNENIVRNKCKAIANAQGSIEIVEGTFDVILANINRHILLQYMPDLYNKLNTNGQIVMSGLLKEDREIMLDAAKDTGFKFVQGAELNNWIALLFSKQV